MINNLPLCGRKRRMSRSQAKQQMAARLLAKPNRPVKIYKCQKCHDYHTTTNYGHYVRNRIWDRLKNN